MPVGNKNKNLCQQRQEKEYERKSLKRKIVDEIKQINAKYRIVQGEIEDLTNSIDKVALKAEKLKSFTYLKESNGKKKNC